MEDLEEDDLDLVEENTGTRIARRSRLTRLRRGRELDSADEAETARPPRAVADVDVSDEDNLGQLDAGGDDVQGIWDDERGDRDDDEDIDSFIDDEDEDITLPPEEREQRRQERYKRDRQFREAISRPDLVGIDARYALNVRSCFSNLRQSLVHGMRYLMFSVTEQIMTGHSTMTKLLRSP